MTKSKDIITRDSEGRIQKILFQLYTRGPTKTALKPSGFARFNRSVYDKSIGSGWCFKELKKGDYSLCIERYYVTPLDVCNRCGKTMRPRHTNYRTFKCDNMYDKRERTALYNGEHSLSFWGNKWYVLCKECWSEVKPVADLVALYFENKYMINKVNREIANERKKNTNNWQP